MKHHLLAAALLLSPTALPAAAQAPINDGAPAQTVAYFGWSGTLAVEADYQGSTLKKVVDLVEPEQVAAAWARWRGLTEAKIDDADFSEGLEVALGLWGASFRGAFAAWVAVGDTTGLTDGEAEDAFYGALCWQPVDAADRTALVAGLQRLLDEISRAHATLEAGDDGPVRLLVGSPTNRAAMAAGGGAGIATHAGFAAARKATGPGVLTAWLDLETLTTTAVDLMRAEGQAPPEVYRVLEVLHPEGLRQIAVAAGYDGPGWGTRVFVDAPAPRRGLAGLLDAPPITDADLAAVPGDAPVVGAWAFDAGELLTLVRAALQAADPQVAQQVNDGIEQAGEMIGADIEQQLVRGLGTSHVFFHDPAIAGTSALGLMIVNRLNDPDGFSQALTGVQNVANGLIAAYTADAPVSVQFHVTERDGVALHTVALPGIAPTWSVFDGRLHLGLYPQSVLAAADRRGAGQNEPAGSILDHPGFAHVRDAAGDHPVTGLSFVDVPETAPGSYGTLLLLENVATGLGSMALRDPFPAMLPPFRRLEPLLAPVTAVGWSDERGYHSAGQSPFPGASLLAGQSGDGGAMQVLPLIWGGVAGWTESEMNGWDDPAVGVAADVAMMADGADPDIHVLRHIGAAARRHAVDHAGRPAFARELLPYLGGDADVFRSFFSENSDSLTAANVSAKTDYILLPGPPIGQEADASITPLLMRNPALVPIEEWSPLPVLYADGHVGMVESLDELAAQYEAATGLKLEAVLGATAP